MTCPVCLGECHNVTAVHLICYNCGRMFVQSVNMDNRRVQVTVEIGVAKNVNWYTHPPTFDMMDDKELHAFRNQWTTFNSDPDDTSEEVY